MDSILRTRNCGNGWYDDAEGSRFADYLSHICRYVNTARHDRGMEIQLVRVAADCRFGSFRRVVCLGGPTTESTQRRWKTLYPVCLSGDRERKNGKTMAGAKPSPRSGVYNTWRRLVSSTVEIARWRINTFDPVLRSEGDGGV